MNMLRTWREHAEERDYTRIAELCDYLQADELTHVKLATDWVRQLTDEAKRDELARWGRTAVARIEGFYADDGYGGADDVRFTFMKEGGAREEARKTVVIGE